MEAVELNILCFGKDSLLLEVSFDCCVLRICHWSEEKGTERELQIANLCATRIVSDNPGLTVGYSASLVWQGATVLWPCSLHSCHLYRSPWPHRCCGYKQRQIMWETPRSNDTQPLTAGATGCFVASSGVGMFVSPMRQRVLCPWALHPIKNGHIHTCCLSKLGAGHHCPASSFSKT